MTEPTQSDILGILQEACLLNGMRFEHRYSGRGMRGNYCVGVVTRSPSDFAFALAEAIESFPFSVRQVREALGPDRQDDMGKSKIMYWPTICTNPERG